MKIHTGKLDLLITQELESESKETLLEVKISDNLKILRIDVCEPEFCSYRDFEIKLV